MWDFEILTLTPVNVKGGWQACYFFTQAFVPTLTLHKQARTCKYHGPQLQEEKTAAIEEKLELSSQKLAQMSSLPEMEEQLKARMEALSQVRTRLSREQHVTTPG